MTIKLCLLASIAFLFVSVSLAEENPMQPLNAVPEVDLARYSGTWYEIARLPNWFQKKCAGNVSATYTLLDDGTIRVTNRCRTENGEITEADGRAKLAHKNGPNTKLRVRFAPAFLSLLPFVWGNYWIIGLAPDYGYAIIGEPNRKYLWILARTPSIEETTFDNILDQVRRQGYDVTDLIRTPQEE